MGNLAKHALKVFVFVIASLFLMADPVSAHGGNSSSASNYKSELAAVSLKTPNVSIELKENGQRVQARNSSNKELVIFGYGNEPYIRVDSRGVFENEASPTTFENRTGNAPPESVSFDSSPKWKRVSTGSVAVWSDRRAQWNEPDPSLVKAEPNSRHRVLPTFVIPFTYDGKQETITGFVEWVPPPSQVPWSLVVVASAVVVVIAVPRKKPLLSLALGVGILLIADILHVSGSFAAQAGTLRTRIGSAITDDLASLAAWVIGAWAIWAALKMRKEIAVFASFFTAAMIFVLGGLTDLDVLTQSQVVSAWPTWLARTVVAVSVGAGMSTVAHAGWAIYRGMKTS